MATAFQVDAFQNDAFQVDATPPPPGGGGGLENTHLGTKESMGVTAHPTIGGWQSWSVLFPFLWLGLHMEKPE